MRGSYRQSCCRCCVYLPTSAMGAGVVHSDAMVICSIIINEMTEGKISGKGQKRSLWLLLRPETSISDE